MDTELQRDAEFDGFVDENMGFVDENLGFVDDTSYSNFSLRGKKYHARKREESAQQAAAAERQATAEREAIAKQLADEAARKKAKADKELADAQAELDAKKQQVVKTDVQAQALTDVANKLTNPPMEEKSNMKTYLIIGGVALLVVGGLVFFMKRRSS